MVRIVVVHDRISQDSCSVLDFEVFAVDKCSTEKVEPQSCMPPAAVDFWLVSSRAAPRLARRIVRPAGGKLWCNCMPAYHQCKLQCNANMKPCLVALGQRWHYKIVRICRRTAPWPARPVQNLCCVYVVGLHQQQAESPNHKVFAAAHMKPYDIPSCLLLLAKSFIIR